MGLREAGTAEIQDGANELVVTPLACSVFGETGPVDLVEGTLVQSLYGVSHTLEPYRCHYGLNPAYRERIFSQGLIVSGTDSGEVRAVERTDHPFFVATLFVPQLSGEQPHPVLMGLLRAARTRP